jgi:UDP-N-acetylmuramoyl-L-alanyl-D-glutamate--2,6-diaminopimelate ligase
VNYSDVKKITFLGIGGKGAFYIAKLFLLLGKEVKGFDLQKSERTTELEKLGANIVYNNPGKGDSLEGDFVVYSNDIPQKLQAEIKKMNPKENFIEVGTLYSQIISDFENNSMSLSEKDFFVKSGIAPLYEIDTTKMKYIGITGTDGKTSTCTMIYHILKENGFKPALITTVSAKIGKEEIDIGLHTTTPTSQELYTLIKKAEKAECTHMILETTSHGLEQGRLSGLEFDIVGYTNISNEHLDYHKTWEHYVDAKALLIKEYLKDGGRAILNLDDKSYSKLNSLNTAHWKYSLKAVADVHATDIIENMTGLSFLTKFANQEIETELSILGEYNVSNFLLACSVCLSLGLDLKDIVKHVSSFETVKGRMEILQKEPFLVIIDYAHTPNALKNALKSAKRLLTDGRLISVFGCAGHRDFYKRSEMGAISNDIADITIIAAEDPRLESLSEINDSIQNGWEENDKKFEKGQKTVYRFDDVKNNVENRKDAIRKALELAQEGDVVIITGKAHEMSLCFGQTEYPWNDIEETKKLLPN